MQLALIRTAMMMVLAWPALTHVLAQTSPPLGQDGSAPVVGAVYNLTLVTDSAPDLTDVDSYLRSITSQYATPQEQAIAIWRWSQRLRKQKTNPKEDGHEVLDPIRMFTSYGYCNCGIISGVNNALWLRLGWQAHYVQLGDHTVGECSWDGGQTWHMFDSSNRTRDSTWSSSRPSAAPIPSRVRTTTAAGGAPPIIRSSINARWPMAGTRSSRPTA